MKPKVVTRIAIGPRHHDHGLDWLTFGFPAKVVKAAQSLADCGAWPANAARFVLVVDALGKSTRCETDFGSHAQPNCDEPESFAPSRRMVSIGKRFLSTPALARLKQSGASDDILLAHALGHETFHMTETDRQSRCKIPYRSVKSGFARSVRSEMSPSWIELCSKCAAHFRGHVRVAPNPPNTQISVFSPQAAAAQDAVSEGCADLIGLRIVEAIFGSFCGLDESLPTIREEMGKQAGEYQSGDFLRSFLASGHPMTLESIVKQSWEYARDKLLAEPNCPDSIKDGLRSTSFQFDSPLADLALSPIPRDSTATPGRRTGRTAGS